MKKKDTNGMNEETAWNTEFSLSSQTDLAQKRRHY